MDENGRQSNRAAGGSTFGQNMDPTEVNANRFASVGGERISLIDAAKSA
jgi:hypothetical protein